MKNAERAPLILDDDIDLSELTSTNSKRLTPKEQSEVYAGSEKIGFVSRQSSRKRVSPYTAQFGGKCRVGMKALFQTIATEMDKYDTETLELAILALIEKEGLEHLKVQYEELVK